MNRSTFYTLFFCLTSFVLIYFEQRNIGPIKLSLWKLPVLLILIYSSFKIPFKRNGLFIISVFLSVKIVLNIFMFVGISDTINEAIYVLVLPVTFNFFVLKYSNKPAVIKKVLLITAVFFLLSALPFILKIIPQSRVLSLYEEEEDSRDALVGIFFHMATSSKVFVVSTLVILFNKSFFVEKKVKWIWYLLIAYGSYCVFLAFTRTGWLLLIFGVCIYLYYTYGRVKFIIISLCLALGFSITYASIIASFDKTSSVYKRVIGESSHNTNEELDLNKLSSGRLTLFSTSINGVIEEGPEAVLLGIGKDVSIRKTQRLLGIGFIAHNRFIEIFCYGGLLALLFFIIYIVRLKNRIIRLNNNNSYRKLLVCLFLLLIFTYMPSHGFPMYCDFLFGIVLAAAYIEEAIERKQLLKSIDKREKNLAL